MKRLFTIISIVFHPITIPLITVLLYFYFTHYYFTRLEIALILSQFSIITLFIPISIYILLKSLRIINSSIMVDKAKERIIPFFINIFLLITLKDFILYNNSAYELKVYIWGLMYTYILLLLFIFLKKKASAHIALLLSSISFIVYMMVKYQTPNLVLLIVLILITGIVASQRLFVKAHTSVEIILGALCGCLPQFFFIFLTNRY